MTLQNIIETLYVGLMPYVANRNKRKYKDEYTSRKTHTTKFALQFFPKYINFDKWVKEPKQPYDILLINYWLIEVPTNGFKNSTLIKDYDRQNNKHINRRLRENKKSSKLALRKQQS
jgi:hypothetical protein